MLLLHIDDTFCRINIRITQKGTCNAFTDHIVIYYILFIILVIFVFLSYINQVLNDDIRVFDGIQEFPLPIHLLLSRRSNEKALLQLLFSLPLFFSVFRFWGTFLGIFCLLYSQLMCLGVVGLVNLLFSLNILSTQGLLVWYW